MRWTCSVGFSRAFNPLEDSTEKLNNVKLWHAVLWLTSVHFAWHNSTIELNRTVLVAFSTNNKSSLFQPQPPHERHLRNHRETLSNSIWILYFIFFSIFIRFFIADYIASESIIFHFSISASFLLQQSHILLHCWIFHVELSNKKEKIENFIFSMLMMNCTFSRSVQVCSHIANLLTIKYWIYEKIIK